MAMKDWKRYRNESDWITYENNSTKIKVTIISHKQQYGWDVRITDISNYNLEYENFDSKKEALKFAQEYMRKH